MNDVQFSALAFPAKNLADAVSRFPNIFGFWGVVENLQYMAQMGPRNAKEFLFENAHLSDQEIGRVLKGKKGRYIRVWVKRIYRARTVHAAIAAWRNEIAAKIAAAAAAARAAAAAEDAAIEAAGLTRGQRVGWSRGRDADGNRMVGEVYMVVDGGVLLGIPLHPHQFLNRGEAIPLSEIVI